MNEPISSGATARSILVESLRHALDEAEATQAMAARWMKVRPITVHRWLHGETPISIEAVLRSRRLSAPFVRYLTRAEGQRKTSGGESWYLRQSQQENAVL